MMELVELELTRHERPADEAPHLWQPFQRDPTFNFDWWNHRMGSSETDVDITIYLDRVEVARATLVEGISGAAYLGEPLGPEALEIAYFEVGSTRRRRGIGSASVLEVGRLFNDRRLAAFSEGADEFWASLGWSRHVHPDCRSRPLFIAR